MSLYEYWDEAFSEYDGYLPIPEEAQLTHPAGFSNFLAQYLVASDFEFLYVKGMLSQGLRLPRNNAERQARREIITEAAIGAMSPEAQIGLAFLNLIESDEFHRPRVLPAALGNGTTVFTARGVAEMPDCDPDKFLRRLASGESWYEGEDRDYESYSLNIVVAADQFAMRDKWARKAQKKCAGLIVAELPAESILNWGVDGESGPYMEAEIHVKPSTAYATHGFLLGKDLALKPVPEETRIQYGLGTYIIAKGNDPHYDMPMVLRLHPSISQKSIDALTSYGFKLQHRVVPDPRTWYEVEL